jgi:hypothetical protein
MPLDQNGRQLSIWDQSRKWYDVDTCFFAHHLYFAKDEDQTLWFSQGRPGPSNGVVGWVKMKTFFGPATPRVAGLDAVVVDTNGNGKRDAYVEVNEPLDPAKDKHPRRLYGIMPSPWTTRYGGGRWASASDASTSRASSCTSFRGPTHRKQRSPSSSFPPMAHGARAAST